MFRISGIDAFERGISAWLEKMEKKAVVIYRGLVLKAYYRVAVETPQWSGNAASNWRIGVNRIDVSFDTAVIDEHWGEAIPPHQKGDLEHITPALNRERTKLTAIRSLDDKVFISNSSKGFGNRLHEFNQLHPYIVDLEENPNNFLRRVNLPGHMVSRVVTEIQDGREISADGLLIGALA